MSIIENLSGIKNKEYQKLLSLPIDYNNRIDRQQQQKLSCFMHHYLRQFHPSHLIRIKTELKKQTELLNERNQEYSDSFYHLDNEQKRKYLAIRENNLDNQKSRLKQEFNDQLYLPLCDNKKILDLGCGPGLITCQLAKFSQSTIGIDRNQKFISWATNQHDNPKLQFVLMNYRQIAFKPNTKFDLITSFSSLGLDENHTIFFQSLTDYLAPDALLIIEQEAKPANQSKLLSELAQAGFQIIDHYSNALISEKEALLLGSKATGLPFHLVVASR